MVSYSDLHLRHWDLAASSCAASLRCSMTDLSAHQFWPGDMQGGASGSGQGGTHTAAVTASGAAQAGGLWARATGRGDLSGRPPPVLPLLASQRPSPARDPRLQHQAISKTAAAAAHAATAAARTLSGALPRRQSASGLARFNAGISPSTQPKALYFRLQHQPTYGVWGPVDLTTSSLQAFAMQPSFVGPSPGMPGWTPTALSQVLPTSSPLSPSPGVYGAGASAFALAGAAAGAAAGGASHSLFRVLCDVSAPQHAGRCVSVHTNVKVVNTLNVEVAIGDAGEALSTLARGAGAGGLGMPARSASWDPYTAAAALSQQGLAMDAAAAAAAATAGGVAGGDPAAGTGSVSLLQRLAPGQSMWLPAPLLLRRSAPSVVSVQALPGPHRAPAAAAWSDPVDLRALVGELAEQLSASVEDDGFCCASRLVRCRMWSHHGREHHASGSPLLAHMLLVATRSDDGKVCIGPSMHVCWSVGPIHM